MTIYEIFEDETGEKYSSRKDIRPEVELALSDQFGEGASQWDDVKAKFKTWKKFVDKVLDVLVKLDCDESWLGEAYLNVEGVGQDILDGADIGTRQGQLAEMLGTDASGRLNRVVGLDMSWSKGSVCFTGALSMTRAKAAELAESAGFEVKSSVSKGLTYLVASDPGSGSSKNEKAKKYGTAVIDEAAFMRLVGRGN